MKNAQNGHHLRAFNINHDVVWPNNHLPGPIDTARTIHLRAFWKEGRLVFNLFFENLGGIRVVVRDVVNDCQQVGDGRLLRDKLDEIPRQSG